MVYNYREKQTFKQISKIYWTEFITIHSLIQLSVEKSINPFVIHPSINQTSLNSYMKLISHTIAPEMFTRHQMQVWVKSQVSRCCSLYKSMTSKINHDCYASWR